MSVIGVLRRGPVSRYKSQAKPIKNKGNGKYFQ
ncbi:hypothetical protein Y695_00592 [Hydrogenophaga sp. T4]|nr:hypothetical protein Y695_00592 [Hydrogenophaga sp. T4]